MFLVFNTLNSLNKRFFLVFNTLNAFIIIKYIRNYFEI